MNLASDLYRRALEQPDSIGLQFETGASFTYGALDRLIAQTADWLESAGVLPGDRVGLHLKNSIELFVLIFAAWRVGTIPVTVNVMYRGKELDHALATTKVRLLVTGDAEHSVNVTEQSDIKIHVLEYAALNDPQRPLFVHPDHANTLKSKPPTELLAGSEALILFTSGSTGTPKAVSITHDGFFVSIQTQARAARGGKDGPYPLAPATTSPNIVALPLFHMGGQKALLFAYHVGRSVVLMERFDARRYMSLVDRFRPDNLFLLPTMLYDLVHLDGEHSLEGVRAALVTGQALSPVLKSQFERRFNVPVLSSYGSTEAGSIAGWIAADVRKGLWKPGSAGKLYPGVELRICDDTGHDVRRGESGEIRVKATIAREYIGQEDSSSLKTADGWILTGDLGYLDNDDVLFLIGRTREMIKCGGFQVFPLEIEEVLRGHPDVRDVAVVGVPDERLGEAPRAFVVPASSDAVYPELEQALVAYCREHLAHYKCIRGVSFMASLPRTAAGKVERNRLAAATGS